MGGALHLDVKHQVQDEGGEAFYHQLLASLVALHQWIHVFPYAEPSIPETAVPVLHEKTLHEFLTLFF